MADISNDPQLITAAELDTLLTQHDGFRNSGLPAFEQLTGLYTSRTYADYTQPLTQHAINQLPHILEHHRTYTTTDLPYNTHQLLHMLHIAIVNRLRVVSNPVTAVLGRDTATDNAIVTCARWWPLPSTIDDNRRNRGFVPAGLVAETSAARYRHAADTLTAAEQEHGTDVLTIAQQLAVDNPTATWYDLLGVADALLTPPAAVSPSASEQLTV
jgi:hypothetical protein